MSKFLHKSREKKVIEAQKEYNYYLQNAEKHPLYHSCWKTFWEKRFDEIKREGKVDPKKYNYEKEWIVYWKNYIEDYYDNKIKFYRKKIESELSKSPINISSDISSDSSDFSPPKRGQMHNKYLESFSSISSASHEKSSFTRDESVTLLTVCRTLSVLDSELGPLMSNKIVDLVAKIIELEKIQGNLSDEILMNSEYILFFETVKEKLKGLIATNLLEFKKVPIVKKLIQSIAQLVHQNPAKTDIIQHNINHKVSLNCSNSKTSPKLDEIIKKALDNFGKLDVSPEELELIREIYLEELEKNITRPLDSAETSAKNLELPHSSPICLQNFSDDELKLLVKNFRQLTDEEQNAIIQFIAEMEHKDPGRVKNLQSCFGEISKINEKTPTIVIDDDDEDYNFEELIVNIRKS